MKTEKWEDWRSGRSLQIALTDLSINTRKEYLSCDMTCIIGELGGNLGFFLGGSLLFAFNIIVENTVQALTKIYMAWQNRNAIRK